MLGACSIYGQGGEAVAPSSAQTSPSPSPSRSPRHINVRGGVKFPGPRWSSPPRVLLVDDDVVYRMLSGRLLQVFGCKIDTAVDGRGAVEVLKMNLGKYDLVFMDIMMPKLDGISATSLIRQFDEMTPIISVTSNYLPSEILAYYSSGMNDVLPKPFTRDGLFNILEKHLVHLKYMQDMSADNSPPPPDHLLPPHGVPTPPPTPCRSLHSEGSSGKENNEVDPSPTSPPAPPSRRASFPMYPSVSPGLPGPSCPPSPSSISSPGNNDASPISAASNPSSSLIQSPQSSESSDLPPSAVDGLDLPPRDFFADAEREGRSCTIPKSPPRTATVRPHRGHKRSLDADADPAEERECKREKVE